MDYCTPIFGSKLDALTYDKMAQYFEDELRHSRNILRISFFALVIPAAIVAVGFFAYLPRFLRYVNAAIETWDAAG